MGYAERARRAARVAAGLTPLPTDAEAEDAAERVAEDLAPALERAFTRRELARLHSMEIGLSVVWHRRGGPGLYELGCALLGQKHELVGPLNVELSRRHVGGAKANSCYWSAARALLVDPGLAGARYCEGISIVNNVHGSRHRSRGMTRGKFGIGVELEGFLRLPDGDVVDPVALVNAEARQVRSAEELIASATYIPLAEYSREEVADRWDELPLSLTRRAGGLHAYRQLHDVFDTFAGAVHLATGAFV
jgi:hypothetical protein